MRYDTYKIHPWLQVLTFWYVTQQKSLVCYNIDLALQITHSLCCSGQCVSRYSDFSLVRYDMRILWPVSRYTLVPAYLYTPNVKHTHLAHGNTKCLFGPLVCLALSIASETE